MKEPFYAIRKCCQTVVFVCVSMRECVRLVCEPVCVGESMCVRVRGCEVVFACVRTQISRRLTARGSDEESLLVAFLSGHH